MTVKDIHIHGSYGLLINPYTKYCVKDIVESGVELGAEERDRGRGEREKERYRETERDRERERERERNLT